MPGSRQAQRRSSQNRLPLRDRSPKNSAYFSRSSFEVILCIAASWAWISIVRVAPLGAFEDDTGLRQGRPSHAQPGTSARRPTGIDPTHESPQQCPPAGSILGGAVGDRSTTDPGDHAHAASQPRLDAASEARFIERFRAGPTDADGGRGTLRGQDAVRILAAEFGVAYSLTQKEEMTDVRRGKSRSRGVRLAFPQCIRA